MLPETVTLLLFCVVWVLAVVELLTLFVVRTEFVETCEVDSELVEAVDMELVDAVDRELEEVVDPGRLKLSTPETSRTAITATNDTETMTAVTLLEIPDLFALPNNLVSIILC